MSKLAFMQKEVENLKNNGLYNQIYTINSSQGSWIEINNKKVLNMCSNNYLGLASHPKLIEAVSDILEKFGIGAGAVRSIAGTTALHQELEEKLANFKNIEATLSFQSGFIANQAVIPPIQADTILTDELNHASIIDGIRLTKSKRGIYSHNDTSDLLAKLEECGKDERKLIITDGVFSMDGDVAKLDEIAKIAEENEAMLMVDDAHGEGVLGDHGKGIVNHFKLDDNDVDIDIGTLSKAFGVVGGYVAGKQILIDFLKQKARPFLFSSALSAPDIASSIAAVDLLQKDNSMVNRLWNNTEHFQNGISDLGYDIGNTQTPITPVLLGDAKLAKNFSKMLLEKNIFATSLGFPTVPKGKARVRVMLSAVHSKDDLNYALEQFESVGKVLDVIK